MKNKRGISAIVAFSLLILVSVASVLSFQSWYQTFISSLSTDTELASEDIFSNLEYETISGEKLYIDAKGGTNIKAIYLDGIDCQINGTFYNITGIDITSCLSQSSSITPDLQIISDKGVLSQKVYLHQNSLNLNMILDYVPVTSCTIINASLLNGNTTVKLMNSLNNIPNTCFSANVGNFIFDCQGNTIDGVFVGSAFDLSGYSNITIQNCIIREFWDGIYTNSGSNYILKNIDVFFNNNTGINLYTAGSNSVLENIEASYQNGQGSLYGNGILLRNSGYSILKNITTNNNYRGGIVLWNTDFSNSTSIISNNNLGDGIYLYDSEEYNIFKDVTLINNSISGIRIRYDVKYNIFNNISIINNSNYGIYFSNPLNSNNTILNSYFENNGIYDVYFQSDSVNNIFYGNSISSYSKIFSNNWSYINYFNTTLSGQGIGNYWRDFSCSSNELRSGYTVCTNPSNYSINLTNNIYDLAPLATWI
jgi:hypothetical protein